MLATAGAKQNVLGCSLKFKCEECLRRQKPAKAVPVSQQHATQFNHTVSADILSIELQSGKAYVLSMVDQASRCMVARYIEAETSK